MSLIQDDAVVIGRLDYSETSQVLVLFTREHGKLRAIAKGVKRGTKTRFAAGVDLLDVGRVVVSSHAERAPGLATLTEWKQTRCFFGLREKLFRLHAAQYAAEVLAQLTEDWDPHPPLYDAFVATLDALSHATEPLSTVVRYQTALLSAIGTLPRVDACVLCGNANEISHFSSLEGGTICRNCETGQVEKRQISSSTHGALRSLFGHTDAPQQESDRSEGSSAGAHSPPVGAFDILDYHIAHLMGREPALSALLVRPEVRRKAQ